jgi:DNA-binding transcriptional regulator YdaS (Cro superfamily)
MSYNLTPYEALRKAVEILGSQQATADLCGVSQTAVWKWLQTSKRLPAEHVLRVEEATGVSRHALRPDIYPRNYPPAPDARFYGVDQRAGAHV